MLNDAYVRLSEIATAAHMRLSESNGKKTYVQAF